MNKPDLRIGDRVIHMGEECLVLYIMKRKTKGRTYWQAKLSGHNCSVNVGLIEKLIR